MTPLYSNSTLLVSVLHATPPSFLPSPNLPFFFLLHPSLFFVIVINNTSTFLWNVVFVTLLYSDSLWLLQVLHATTHPPSHPSTSPVFLSSSFLLFHHYNRTHGHVFFFLVVVFVHDPNLL